MTQSVRHSPLYERQVALGAKFAEFGGWLMPLEYAGHGVLAEHRAVRGAVGVFDVSHLGKVIVTGPGAVDHLNRVLTNDLTSIGPGQAQYTLLCTPEGGVVDDLIAYVHDDESVLLVPNAANSATVCQQVGLSAPDTVRVVNAHRDYAIVAVQGPQADRVMAAAGLLPDSGQPIDYLHFTVVERDGSEITVCRTGYTGERGYELVIPNEAAGQVWDALLSDSSGAGPIPCGLGARDTLRLEMGYPLHGHDISVDINPVEAGLSWAVGWSKPTFLGAERLREIREQGPQRRLRGLKATGRGIPREGMTVVDSEDGDVGVITSGTFSPSLKQGIALALVGAEIKPGAQVGVRVRSRVEPCDVVSPPFVPSHVRDPAG